MKSKTVVEYEALRSRVRLIQVDLEALEEELPTFATNNYYVRAARSNLDALLSVAQRSIGSAVERELKAREGDR